MNVDEHFAMLRDQLRQARGRVALAALLRIASHLHERAPQVVAVVLGWVHAYRQGPWLVPVDYLDADGIGLSEARRSGLDEVIVGYTTVLDPSNIEIWQPYLGRLDPDPRTDLDRYLLRVPDILALREIEPAIGDRVALGNAILRHHDDGSFSLTAHDVSVLIRRDEGTHLHIDTSTAHTDLPLRVYHQHLDEATTAPAE